MRSGFKLEENHGFLLCGKISKSGGLLTGFTNLNIGLVRTYLGKLLPDDWHGMSLYERRNYLNGSEFGGESRVGTVERILVCNMEIWCECFGRDASAMKPADSYAIAGIMKKISGWNKYQGNKNGTSNFSIYGKQRCYEKSL
ncbi:MAG: hypothetical protein ACRCXQ_04765 [Vagococcus fluvialis]